MTKYVSDTKAGKSISAWVIFKGKNRIATVKAHFSDSGVCLVNVHDGKAGFQYARASGYGYDKFNSALSGMTIDGHVMTDHCEGRYKPGTVFPRGSKCPKGYSFANYSAEKGGYTSCYREAGLDYLKARGYTVAQAI